MKCQGNYEGNLPTLNVIKEGTLLRIFFDYEDAPVTDEDGDVKKYICENVDVEGRSYAEIVSALIHSRYSQDSVEAIIANYEIAKNSESDITDTKRAEYIEEYNDYQAFRVRAKEIANNVINSL
jgi:hypothetical protein